MLEFDLAGELLEVTNHPSLPAADGGAPGLRERNEAFVRWAGEFFAGHDARRAPIAVKRFFIAELSVGIEDLTCALADCVPDADNTEAVYGEYAETLEEWKSEGCYVLWWGRTFEMGGDGSVITS